jgi:hypothetical protein
VGTRPKNATGQCTDGTYTTAKTENGGCTKHGGVATWFGVAGATAAAKTTAAASTSAAPDATSHTSAAAAGQHVGTRPKNATGQCTDGTYTTAKTENGGCTKHGGVATWFGVGVATAATPTEAPARAPASSSATAPSSTLYPSAAAAAPAQAPSEPGQVWVNTATKIYHCAGSKYYGNTKAGKYMSEAEAKAAGYRAAYGKACN